jgi:beta-phosphoglucomutase-like phosphatase (HAD superfamily)
MRPDAVVFDFDGVLADSEPLHLRVYQELLAAEHLTLPAAEYYSRYLGLDDVGVFEALARDKGLQIENGRLNELIARKTALFKRCAAAQHVLFPGAAASVQTISALCPVAIASGALREDIETILRSTQLASIFAVIVAAGETAQGKPAPDPYARALALLADHHGTTIHPERSVAIEDSHWGLESARAAGLRTIAVTTSYEARDLGASDLIVPDISHVTPDRLDRVMSGRTGVPMEV